MKSLSGKLKSGGTILAGASLIAVIFAASAQPLGSEFDNKYGLEYDAALAERIERNGSDALSDKIATYADRGGVRIQTAAQKMYDTLTQ